MTLFVNGPVYAWMVRCSFVRKDGLARARTQLATYTTAIRYHVPLLDDEIGALLAQLVVNERSHGDDISPYFRARVHVNAPTFRAGL